MSREDVQNAAKEYIRDTGLIDYVLKRMDNVLVDGYVVRHAINSRTSVLEFSLRETPENAKELEETGRVDLVPGSEVYNDLAFLYKHLLSVSKSGNVKFALKTILDTKNFSKEWPFLDVRDGLPFIYRVILTDLNLETGFLKGKELVREELVVPFLATVHNLKAAVESAMRDTYCIMENLKVREIVELEGKDDDEFMLGELDLRSEISVCGSGVDLLTTSKLNYEGGAENWVVNCKCGAKDDDGEKMAECDGCRVWQHTTCNGISDSETDPHFLCGCPASTGPDADKLMPSHKWDIPLDDILFLNAGDEDDLAIVGNLDDLVVHADSLDDLLLGLDDPTFSHEQKDQTIKNLRDRVLQLESELKTSKMRIIELEAQLNMR